MARPAPRCAKARQGPLPPRYVWRTGAYVSILALLAVRRTSTPYCNPHRALSAETMRAQRPLGRCYALFLLSPDAVGAPARGLC